jgi:DNA processing protein
MDNDLRSLIAFYLIDGIGIQTARKLIGHFISPSEVFKADLGALMSVKGSLMRLKAERIVAFRDWDKVDSIIEKIHKLNMQIVKHTDESYPELLKQIHDPPLIFFMKGNLIPADKLAIAIVGTRAVTTYGKDVTEKLSGGLASMGVTIVSGMARGVDTIAHNSALNAAGRTIAVLGSSLDIIYPYENKGLYNRIIEQGAVISEYLPGTPPSKLTFPVRNRIVSGLSLGVLVTEAPEQSGALITASHALEQNREVFAVPGNIMSNKSEGTHKLIKDGAKFVSSVNDILVEIGVTIKDFVEHIPKKPPQNLDNDETILYNMLSSEPIHIDDIIRQTKMSSANALSVLLTLEIKGIVKQISGMKFYLMA